MGQFAPIVFKDEAAANVTFAPVKLAIGGLAEAAYRPSGNISLQSMLTIQPRADKQRQTSGVKLKITLPLVRAVDGVDMVVENIIADIDVRYPNGATDAERSRIIAYLSSALNATQAPLLAPVLKGTEALW